MPFLRPGLGALQARVQADMRARIEGAQPSLRRSALGIIATALAGAVHGLYGYISQRATQAVPYTATGADLEGWASLWGIGRRSPTIATGSIGITGDAGISVPADTALQSQNGTEYRTTAAAVIGGGGTALASVAAQITGSIGNQPAGVVLSFVSPVLGVDALANVDPNGLNGGADREDDESLRARLQARISNPPHGGNAADYVEWALSVPGVTRAWVKPLYLGAGNVRVYIADDSYVGATLASAGTVATAQAYLDSVRPVTADVDAVAPNRQPVNIRVTLGPDSPAIRAAVTAALADLFLREAEPEGTIPRTHIAEAISQAAGEYDHNLILPAGNVTAGAGAILTLGTLTWV